MDFGTGTTRVVPGLASCSPDPSATRSIDPEQPLVLLVHGCYSSGGRFRALASVFELHGQQTLCFNYDYRDSLQDSADQLKTALRGLRRYMRDDRLTVIGHSQGGLVARAALSGPIDASSQYGNRPESRLVTVSSPFAGIQLASHCGSIPLHVATLGVTVAVCQIATGSNWNEIHPAASMVRDPAPLGPAVADHLIVMTDERDSCRRRDPAGACEEADFVFSLEEQDNPLLRTDDRVRSERIEAGHVEIVGDEGTRPEKLIEALQRHDVLPETPPDKRQALARLLRRIF